MFANAYEADPARFLYHYTTREVALGSILPLGELRFGPLAWMNDPREFEQWIVGVSGTMKPELPHEEFLTLVRTVDRLVRATVKVASFTMDAPLDEQRSVGNANFKRGWAHHRMWAQYAGGHTGVCLVFDRLRLTECVSAALEHCAACWHQAILYADGTPIEYEAANLTYDDVPERGLEAVVNDHILRHWQGLYFVKNMDWASEREYRWAVRDADERHVFVPVGDALSAVVVGARFPTRDLELLRSYADDYNFAPAPFGEGRAVMRCEWRNGTPSAYPAGEPLRI